MNEQKDELNIKCFDHNVHIITYYPIITDFLINKLEFKKENCNYFEYQFLFEPIKNLNLKKEIQNLDSYKLAAGKYYYNMSLNKYYIIYKSGDISIWDFSNKEFKTYINQITNIRSMFFLHILDPLSIAIMEYNKLVLHGALLKKKNKEEGLLILGKSGYGKSTISNILSKKYNYYVYSDDVLYVKDTELGIAEGIDVGLGFLKNNSCQINDEYSYEIETERKKYFFRKHKLSDSIKITNIIILADKNYKGFVIEQISKEAFLKKVLNLQTNIPSKFLKNKLNCLEKLYDKCNTYSVKYDQICNVEKLCAYLERVNNEIY